VQAGLGDIVAIAHACLGGVGCDHAMAGIVEQKVPQEVICLLPGQGLVGLMGRQFLLNGLEQALVQNRRLLPGQDLTPVFDLVDEKPVVEKVREGSSSERDASAGLAAAEGPRLGADVLDPEVPDKFVDAGGYRRKIILTRSASSSTTISLPSFSP